MVRDQPPLTFEMFHFASNQQRTISYFFPLIVVGIFHCFMEFNKLKGQPGSDVTIRDLGLQTDFAVYLQIRQTWLAFSTELHIFSTFLFCCSPL